MRVLYVCFSLWVIEDQCTIYARHDQNTYTWVSPISGDIACDTYEVGLHMYTWTVCCTPMYSKGSQDEKELCAIHSSPKWPFTLATFILVLSKNVQFCQWLRFTTLKTDQTSSLAAATPWHETVHCRLDLNLFSSSRWKMMTTAAIVNCPSILDYP